MSEVGFAPPVAAPPKESTRPKSTLNLNTILKAKIVEDKPIDEAVAISPPQTKTVSQDELKLAWDEFAELRKNQVGEYNLLKRGFELNDTKITIALYNVVEEPMLQSIRTQLTAYLRDRLNNSHINVFGVLQEIEAKRMAYTNKEKFDYLAEKNPLLLELKERLGLDTDY